MSKVIIITASAALVAALSFPVIAVADGGGQPPRATVETTPTPAATPTPTPTPAATPTPTPPPEPQVLGAQSDGLPPADRLLLAGLAGFVVLRLMVAAGRRLSHHVG